MTVGNIQPPHLVSSCSANELENIHPIFSYAFVHGRMNITALLPRSSFVIIVIAITFVY